MNANRVDRYERWTFIVIVLVSGAFYLTCNAVSRALGLGFFWTFFVRGCLIFLFVGALVTAMALRRRKFVFTLREALVVVALLGFGIHLLSKPYGSGVMTSRARIICALPIQPTVDQSIETTVQLIDSKGAVLDEANVQDGVATLVADVDVKHTLYWYSETEKQVLIPAWRVVMHVNQEGVYSWPVADSVTRAPVVSRDGKSVELSLACDVTHAVRHQHKVLPKNE